MATINRYRFNAQLAEFGQRGMVSIIYGGPETRLKEELKEMTWPQAQAYLLEFQKDAPAPSACFVTCLDKPLPRGYNSAERRVYKEHSEQRPV